MRAGLLSSVGLVRLSFRAISVCPAHPQMVFWTIAQSQVSKVAVRVSTTVSVGRLPALFP